MTTGTPLQKKILAQALKLDADEISLEDELSPLLQKMGMREIVALGHLEVADSVSVEVSVMKVKKSDSPFDDCFYALKFGEKIGTVHFLADTENKKGFFWGIIIHPDHKGTGLAKPLLKYLFHLFLDNGYSLCTTAQKKPLVNLILQKLGFESTGLNPVFINKNPSSNQVEVYSPRGHLFTKKAILSQNILALDTCPAEFYSVDINVSFVGNADKVRAQLKTIRGTYVILGDEKSQL
jgi:ribosomal protein S18 acetylase RimI-like enzyme